MKFRRAAGLAYEFWHAGAGSSKAKAHPFAKKSVGPGSYPNQVSSSNKKLAIGGSGSSGDVVAQLQFKSGQLAEFVLYKRTEPTTSATHLSRRPEVVGCEFAISALTLSLADDQSARQFCSNLLLHARTSLDKAWDCASGLCSLYFDCGLTAAVRRIA